VLTLKRRNYFLIPKSFFEALTLGLEAVHAKAKEDSLKV
jgi:hypothetical protein